MVASGMRGSIAVFALDRSFGCAVKAIVHIDKIPTLTTKNNHLFMLSLEDHDVQWSQRRLHRHLHVRERFALQGHPPHRASLLPAERLAHTMSGNAFAVSQVAAVAVPLWKAIAASGILHSVEGSFRSKAQLEALSIPVAANESSLSQSLEEYLCRELTLGSSVSVRQLRKQWRQLRQRRA